MADSKKSSLLQAVSKLKNAKKNVAANQEDGSKGIKPRNAKGDAIKEKIKDAVAKFEGEQQWDSLMVGQFDSFYYSTIPLQGE